MNYYHPTTRTNDENRDYIWARSFMRQAADFVKDCGHISQYDNRVFFLKQLEIAELMFGNERFFAALEQAAINARVIKSLREKTLVELRKLKA